jgi:hypothetical protein
VYPQSLEICFVLGEHHRTASVPERTTIAFQNRDARVLQLDGEVFRFKGRRAVARQLTRIVAREFDQALKEIGGDQIANHPEAVHDARKSVKKIRAVERLIRRDLEKDYRVQNRELRTIAHAAGGQDVSAALSSLSARPSRALR